MDVRRIIQDASQTPAVRARLRNKALRISNRAQVLAAREGFRDFPVEVIEGTRPGLKARGFRRPYARVVARHTDAAKIERGRGGYAKYRLLQRASRAVGK